MTPSTSLPPAEQPGAGLDIAGLETVYDTLAAAIDRAGPEHAQRFLVKLALLQANALGDVARFEQQVQIALSDL
ncbi:MAG: DUF2783 domain-containing protein [Tepidimonas fonticaldi]|nr:DUF2783 domain-containing protein [Tepidimonas fonticaldi]